MSARAGLESRDQILETARELGITERQVRRWRGEGLLPKLADQEWRGRGRGSATFYPAGTCRQLRAAARWFEHDRRVDVVRWVLWCDGLPVDPDPHDGIVRVLRAGGRRAAERSGDCVSHFAEMLHAAAEAAHDVDPGAVPDLASLLHRIVAPRRTGISRPPTIGPVPAELDRLVGEALRTWQADGLQKYLTSERLHHLRDRALLLYGIWAPERAAREPLPPRVLIAMIVLNAIGVPIGMVVDFMVHTPDGADTGRKLRDWLLDDSVWRKPRRRRARA